MSASSTDRIRREIVVRAPRARAWQALTDSGEFGAWFQARFDGPFRLGEWTRAVSTHEGSAGQAFGVLTEHLEPEARFAFRWHLDPVAPGRDLDDEPTTRVEFVLEEVEGGTRIVMTESGFDALPEPRRFEVLRRNEGGWNEQVQSLRGHLDG